ncbi:MAG TPA: Gfo/Idh/MocA family oxidoreductase [Acidimicrobiia bacterium]|jgi:predicted dehydrogenase|nr:Gfo/Idh/MocA family oxidoreductase [Acidimicrobiia bacterium]
MDTVRIGILGAARIAPSAVIKPARTNNEAVVGAVAARDRNRAEAFASKHGIPKVCDSYAELLADPDIDAIYNPLPNGLHAEWTIAALEAGKHVLCEKPFTANAAEAEAVAAVAERSGLVVMEAFHYRYHPLAQRMREIVESGELGTTRRIETALCFPLPKFSDIRYQYDLAGGATMDVGTYTVHTARLLGCEEPEVVSAEAKLRTPNVDRAMRADLAFPSGHTGRITCSMWSKWVIQTSARVVGDRGEMRVINPTAPQLWHRMRVKSDGKTRSEKFPRRPTYEYQLDAFCAAVLRGEPTLTPPADSIANMRVLDAIYLAAGMTPRGT